MASSTTFIEIAMIIFLVVFLLIVAWTLLGRPDRFQRAARIPLDEKTIQTPREAPNATDHGARPQPADTDGGAR